MPEPSPRVRRDVVSFVRRSTRLNASQQKAWDDLADRLVVPLPRGERSTSIAPGTDADWAATFGREAPLLVEIGSGRGEALVAWAEQHPEANVVSFEVFLPSVASTLSRINRHGVDNVRIVMADGVEGLRYLFDEATIGELWTFFPDPWHKPRHHKRRLVSPEFAALVASRLVPGGVWRLATDWDDYAEAMREVLDASPGLENVHGGWAPRFEGRPITKYEARGLDAGRTVHDLTYRRPDAPVVHDLLHRTPIAHARPGTPL